GFPSSSSTSSSIFRPAACRPISSRYSSVPVTMSLPICANGPLRGAIMPILIGPCACASLTMQASEARMRIRNHPGPAEPHLMRNSSPITSPSTIDSPAGLGHEDRDPSGGALLVVRVRGKSRHGQIPQPRPLGLVRHLANVHGLHGGEVADLHVGIR